MKRDLSVETLRIAAIGWILLFHVAGGQPGAGLGFHDTAPIQYLIHTLRFFPVPIFALLAGYVSGLHPFDGRGFRRFIQRKFTRILLPALGFGLFYFSLRIWGPGVNERPHWRDLPQEILAPTTHMWFLYALFWTFGLYGLVARTRLLGRPLSWLLIFIFTIFMYHLPLRSSLLSLNGLYVLAPYFFLGYGLGRFPHLWTKKVRALLFIIGIALFAFNQYLWFTDTELPIEQFKLSQKLMSFTLLPLFVFWTPPLRVLYCLAPFTYVLYLFHPIGAGLGRIILRRLGVLEPVSLTLACCAFALCFALLVGMIPRGLRTLQGIRFPQKRELPPRHHYDQ